MSSKIGIIIEREYLERVKKKSFIFTTLAMPILMVILMALPAILVAWAGSPETTVLVVDNSGSVGAHLEDDDDITFTLAAPGVSVDSALRVEDVDMVLVIPENIIPAPKSTLKIYSNGPSSVSTESTIRSQVNDIVEEQRLAQYNIGNLAEILEAVKSNVGINTIRQDKGDDEESLSTDVSFGIGMGMSLTLYMFLIIYGQMVMTSIIEEKNNRVLEVVVTSVKPMQIMMGKIIGVALVALTQIVLWGMLIMLMSGLVLPSLVPQDGLQDMIADGDTMASALSSLTDFGQVSALVGLLTLFLMLGFLVYAAIFAAIGSSVDNIQDASQLSSIALMPIIFGFIFGAVAAANPSGPVAFWSSIFPLTAPMVMVARIPFGIPAWEIIIAVILLVLSFFGLVWVAGKIYRVGIFMYGKKPTIKEMIKWISYK